MKKADSKTDTRARAAGIYVRISRDQTGEGLGVARQEEDCRLLAQRLGWDAIEIYIDNDVSATSRKPRPAYRKMLADLEAGRIDAVLAWHPDRLYRRAVDLGELVEVVQRLHVPVATANAGEVDLNSPTGLLVAEMLAAIAMYEVRHKSERWSRSWRQQREAGKVARTGSRMFGYTQEGVIVAEEAAIAREMAARLASGTLISHVALWLEAEDVRATRGHAWTPQALKRYLTNPRIAGWSTLNGEIVAKGEWEPILDQDTYETVKAILTARTSVHGPRKSVLVGMVFCGVCDHRLVTSGSRGNRTYRCPSRPGMRGCGGVSAKALPVEALVEQFAKTRAASPAVHARLAELRQKPTTALAELAHLDTRIAELEAQLEEPDVPVTTLLRAIDRTKAKREDTTRELASASVSALVVHGGEWPEDLQRRRAAIEMVVERVVIGPVTERLGPRFDGRRVKIDPR